MKKMKKIALVSFSNNYDMQEYLYTLYDDMKDLDNKVMTIGSSKVVTDIKLEQENILINAPERPGVELKTFNIIELLKVIYILRKVDVVYFISSHVWNLFIIKCLKSKVKIIHTIHDPFPHENEKNTSNVKNYNQFVCNNINEIVLLNSKLKDDFKKYYGYKGNTYCAQLWRKWRELKEKKVQTKNVLFFGRVNPYKGVETVVELAKDMKGYQFRVVGRFSEESKQYKDKLKELENVYVLDTYLSEKDIEVEFDNADIVILPYKSATQSGVVVEAYRFGRPVIAFNVGGLEEQIEEGVSGFLVDECDYEQFKERIENYLNLEDEERIKFCNKSWEFGKNLFSTDEIVRIINKISEV